MAEPTQSRARKAVGGKGGAGGSAVLSLTTLAGGIYAAAHEFGAQGLLQYAGSLSTALADMPGADAPVVTPEAQQLVGATVLAGGVWWLIGMIPHGLDAIGEKRAARAARRALADGRVTPTEGVGVATALVEGDNTGISVVDEREE